MTTIDELAGGAPARATRPPVARGRVVKAPASFDAALSVVLTNYSSAYEFEVPAANWITRGALPAQGDRCLVFFDDDGDAWSLISTAPAGTP